MRNSFVNATIQEILSEALVLKPLERTQLMDALLESFVPRQPQFDDAWKLEVESRIDALEVRDFLDDSADGVTPS